MTLEQLDKRLDRIDKKLNTLLSDSRKETAKWVKVSFVLQVTGWTKEKLRQARNQGLVKCEKRQDKSIWYDLNSLDAMFIKNKPATA